MKRVTTVFLCLLLCLPAAGLAQDFLVSDAALAAPRATGAFPCRPLRARIAPTL